MLEKKLVYNRKWIKLVKKTQVGDCSATMALLFSVCSLFKVIIVYATFHRWHAINRFSIFTIRIGILIRILLTHYKILDWSKLQGIADDILKYI